MSKKVDLRDLIKSVSKETNTAQSYSINTIEAFLREIKKRLIDGEEVKIEGFATISTYLRKKTNRRLPHNGKAVVIPAKTAIRFQISDVFNSELVALDAEKGEPNN